MTGAPRVTPHDPHRPVRRPAHQDRTSLLLRGVTETEEHDVTMFATELASDRWARDLATARTARLATAIRKRRAAERSQDRARRLVRLASLAAQRSETLAAAGAFAAAR